MTQDLEILNEAKTLFKSLDHLQVGEVMTYDSKRKGAFKIERL